MTVMWVTSDGERRMFQATGAAIVEQQRTGLRVEPRHANEESKVANAGDDEGFFGRCRRLRLVIPEADQQVGSETDQFPTHEEQQQAVGDDDAQHGPGKQRQEAKKAGKVFVVLHIADAVDKDQQPDKGDHHQHDGGQRIEHPAKLQPLIAKLKPAKIYNLAGHQSLTAERENMRESDDGQNKGDRHGADGQRSRRHAIASGQQRADSGGHSGQRGHQPQVLHNPGHRVSDGLKKVEQQLKICEEFSQSKCNGQKKSVHSKSLSFLVQPFIEFIWSNSVVFEWR